VGKTLDSNSEGYEFDPGQIYMQIISSPIISFTNIGDKTWNINVLCIPFQIRAHLKL
jgi:hypothetical protein